MPKENLIGKAKELLRKDQEGELETWDYYLADSDLDNDLKELLKDGVSVIDHPDYLNDDDSAIIITDDDDEDDDLADLPEENQDNNDEKKEPKTVIYDRKYAAAKYQPTVDMDTIKQQVSELTEYLPYEVDDVINAALILIRRHILEGRCVSLTGIGKLYLHRVTKGRSFSEEEKYNKKDYDRLFVRPEAVMKFMMKKTYDKRNRIMERLHRCAAKRIYNDLINYGILTPEEIPDGADLLKLYKKNLAKLKKAKQKAYNKRRKKGTEE